MFAKNFDIRAHEACWGLFLGVVLARATIFCAHPLGSGVLLTWIALIVGFAWAVRQSRKEGTLGRVGYAYYPVAMNIAFELLGTTLRHASDWRADAVLQAADAAMIGGNLSLKLQPYISPLACDAFSFAYMSFIVLLFVSMAYYLVKSPNLPRFYRGLFSLYGIGFIGYIVMPAAGPYVAMKDAFSRPIAGGLMTHLNGLMVANGSNHVDVFPSLHVAISAFIWLSLMKDHRKIALAIFPVVALLWGSTIFLRYHYLIDVIVGGALAVLVFWYTAVSADPLNTTRTKTRDYPALH